MPFWAEKIGVPRTLAVEFPFGHLLGRPHDAAQQMRVIHQALEVLETAADPGEIVHSPEAWPVPTKQAIREWQPEEPSPIVEAMTPRLISMMREQRRNASSA